VRARADEKSAGLHRHSKTELEDFRFFVQHTEADGRVAENIEQVRGECPRANGARLENILDGMRMRRAADPRVDLEILAEGDGDAQTVGRVELQFEAALLAIDGDALAGFGRAVRIFAREIVPVDGLDANQSGQAGPGGEHPVAGFLKSL